MMLGSDLGGEADHCSLTPQVVLSSLIDRF